MNQRIALLGVYHTWSAPLAYHEREKNLHNDAGPTRLKESRNGAHMWRENGYSLEYFLFGELAKAAFF